MGKICLVAKPIFLSKLNPLNFKLLDKVIR